MFLEKYSRRIIVRSKTVLLSTVFMCLLLINLISYVFDKKVKAVYGCNKKS
jgi:hypothetical protein